MKNVQFSKILILVLLINVLSGCSQKPSLNEEDLNARFQKGVELYEEERYLRAIDEFTYVVLNAPGTELADDAQLYLGDSHYQLKEYVVAISEYERLVQRMPSSPLVEEARFRIGKSYYELSPAYALDQVNTENAIQVFQSFLDDYPDSKHRDEVNEMIQILRGKLGKKSLENARLYKILREWEAAIIYYDDVLDNYYDTPWAQFAAVEKAECLVQLGKLEEAQELLKTSIPFIEKPSLLTKARELFNQTKTISSKSNRQSDGGM
jgi:outer membrane protein assembly factor BamD